MSRPAVVSERAQKQRLRANTRAVGEWYAHTMRQPWYERARMSFRLTPELFTLGVLALMALLALAVLLFAGRVSIESKPPNAPENGEIRVDTRPAP